MPRARQLINYLHAHYTELVSRVSDTGETIVLPMSRTVAASGRADFYAFRRVALLQPAEAQRLGIPMDKLNNVMLSITDEGLAFRRTDDNPLAGLIESALGKKIDATLPPAPAPVAAAKPAKAAKPEDIVDFGPASEKVSYGDVAASAARLLESLKNG